MYFLPLGQKQRLWEMCNQPNIVPRPSTNWFAQSFFRTEWATRILLKIHIKSFKFLIFFREIMQGCSQSTWNNFGSCNGLANFKLNKTKFGWSKEIQFQNRMNQNASFKNILKSALEMVPIKIWIKYWDLVLAIWKVRTFTYWIYSTEFY